MSDLLFYGGIALITISFLTGLVFVIALWVSKRKLNANLDAEYGKNHRNPF